MIVKYCEELLLRIRKQQVIYAKSLTSGAFSTLQDYKESAGVLAGLKQSEHLVREVYKDFFNSKQLGEYDGVESEIETEFY